MICFRTERIDFLSLLTPSDCQDLAKIVENSGASLWIDLQNNSPDTVKRMCQLSPGVRVNVRLSDRGRRGHCNDITFSPHTDNINMFSIFLYPGQVTRLHQLVSLSQSWTVRYRLWLYHLGAEDWTELSRSLDTLDSVREVRIIRCSAPPSVSLLETLWNKTEEELKIDEKYYKRNEEDFSKLVRKHFQ